jgi:thiol-disulfide isomerase/thioredoxin
VKRNIAVLAVIILFITGLFWAGVRNVRARRAQEALIRQKTITLHPDDKSGSVPDSGDDAPPDLRGKTAPSFNLSTLDGKKVSLASLKGKPVLVNFWATWCVPCRIEMPWFEEFSHKYAAQNLVIVGITEDDASREEIKQALTKAGVTYPVLLTDNKADRAYGGIDYLPSSFYVDREGKIVAQSAGLGTKDQIEADIKKITGGA